MKLELSEDSHLTMLEIVAEKWASARVDAIGKRIDRDCSALMFGSLEGFIQNEKHYGAIVLELMEPIDPDFLLPMPVSDEFIHGKRCHYFASKSEKIRMVEFIMNMAGLI